MFDMIDRRTLLKSLGAAALVAATTNRFSRAQTTAPVEIPGADAQDPMAAALTPLKVGIRKVTDHFYILLGNGGNIGVVDGPDDLLVIDAGLADTAKNTARALQLLNKATPAFLINTHHHFDHTGGNEAVHALGCKIVAHKNAYDLLSKKVTNDFLKMTFDPLPPAARPAITFDDTLTLHANGDTITLTHLPPAHTNNDIVVRFEKAGVVHTGDLFFNGAFPFIDAQVGGSLDGMINAQEKIAAMIDDTIKVIPGHGPLGNKADLKAATDVLKIARDKIKPLVDAGKSSEEVVAAKPLAQFNGKYGKGFLSDDAFVALIHYTYTYRPK